MVVEAATRSKGMSSGSNAPALRSEDEAVRRGRATRPCEAVALRMSVGSLPTASRPFSNPFGEGVSAKAGPCR